jgi:thymidylate synthase
MPTLFEAQYRDLLRSALCRPCHADRTGVGTRSTFGAMLEADVQREGIPLLDCKTVHVKSVLAELVWMLQGRTNSRWLEERGCTIWKAWAHSETGELGRVYGAQWRRWVGASPSGLDARVDQLAKLMRDLRESPFSRRHVLTAWQPAELHQMALPPCPHAWTFKAEAREGKRPLLHLMVSQRSADLFLGVPFDAARDCCMLQLLAWASGMEAGRYALAICDAHVYENHVDQAEQMLERRPRERADGMEPRLFMKLAGLKSTPQSIGDVDALEPSDLVVEPYNPQGPIKAPVAV